MIHHKSTLYTFTNTQMTKINKSLITAYAVNVILADTQFDWIRSNKNIYERMNDAEKEVAQRIIERAEEERKWRPWFKRYQWIADERIDWIISLYISEYEDQHDTRKFKLKWKYLGKDRDCKVYDIFTYDENWEYVDYYDRVDLVSWQTIEHYVDQCEFYLNHRHKEEA